MTDTKSRAKENTTAKNGNLKKEPRASVADSNKRASSGSEKKSHTLRSGSYAVVVMFIVLLMLLAALGYQLEKQQKELARRTHSQIEQLRNEVKPKLVQLNTASHELQQNLASQERQQQALSEAFSNLLKTRRDLRNDWLLAEADYLLRLASHRLLLARDTGSALAAVQAADERLHDMTDPAVTPLRRMLAKDINRLKAVPEPDITGLSARLSALAQNVDSLPLLSAHSNKSASKATATNDHDGDETRIKDWKQLPQAIWGDIKKLVVIRERHGRVVPLLSPKQHFFLIQNLKLKLEQARLALLNTEPVIYKERLQSAIGWIHDFFKQDDSTTQAMLSQLKQLADKNIKPALPDISASYRALQNFRDKQSENAKRVEGPA